MVLILKYINTNGLDKNKQSKRTLWRNYNMSQPLNYHFNEEQSKRTFWRNYNTPQPFNYPLIQGGGYTSGREWDREHQWRHPRVRRLDPDHRPGLAVPHRRNPKRVHPLGRWRGLDRVQGWLGPGVLRTGGPSEVNYGVDHVIFGQGSKFCVLSFFLYFSFFLSFKNI